MRLDAWVAASQPSLGPARRNILTVVAELTVVVSAPARHGPAGDDGAGVVTGGADRNGAGEAGDCDGGRAVVRLRHGPAQGRSCLDVEQTRSRH